MTNIAAENKQKTHTLNTSFDFRYYTLGIPATTLRVQCTRR